MSTPEQEILPAPVRRRESSADAGRVVRRRAAPTPGSAWEHVYRLLLWIDRTTGLAHCYESDKSQPGRPWYERSLRFHGWVAQALGASPTDLAGEIDSLFRQGTKRLAEAVAQIEAERRATARTQREASPHSQSRVTIPGSRRSSSTSYAPWLTETPTREALAELTRVVRNYFTQENKRRNLVGEGFEDVLAAILERLPCGSEISVTARPLLSAVPGFRPPPRGEKERRVDLAVIAKDARRTLLSVKWSIRADREEQFGIDWEAYARLEDEGQDFDFVLVTNEFDAAGFSPPATAAGRAPISSAASSTSIPPAHLRPMGRAPRRRRAARRAHGGRPAGKP